MTYSNGTNDNSNDSPLGPVNIGRSDKDILELIKELTDKCTNLETKCNNLEAKVLDLKTLLALKAKEIKLLKLQVQTLKGHKGSRTTKFKRLKKVGGVCLFTHLFLTKIRQKRPKTHQICQIYV